MEMAFSMNWNDSRKWLLIVLQRRNILKGNTVYDFCVT